MNPFEQQMKLGRDLMELNSEWFRKLAEFDSRNFNDYVQFNQDFAGRLPEVKDIGGFVDLQREYGEQLWNSTQETMKVRGEMLRDAFNAGNETIRKAFSPEAEEKPQAKRSSTKSSATKAAA